MNDGGKQSLARGRARRLLGDGAVRRIAARRSGAADLYHRLLTIPWPGFFAAIAIAYGLFNIVFGMLYALQPGAVANAHPGSFGDAFFFSVQTMATIGYGDMHPATFYANAVVTVEVLLGMTGLALATGLMFARFSRPTARVIFSRKAVIAPYNGAPTLMFRAANQRRNQILEAQISVAMLRNEVTAEGKVMRRFYDLALARSRTPMFSLTWTVMHELDEKSPFYRCTSQSLEASEAEIVITLIGIDETFAQTIHARHTYGGADIVWNHRFADILSRLEDGTRVIDYRRFDELVPIAG
ncbi:MAG TPA: ion channel [Stellaceae bacterium]|nr:ion channel [Stellaceae bacterium]